MPALWIVIGLAVGAGGTWLYLAARLRAVEEGRATAEKRAAEAEIRLAGERLWHDLDIDPAAPHRLTAGYVHTRAAEWHALVSDRLAPLGHGRHETDIRDACWEVASRVEALSQKVNLTRRDLTAAVTEVRQAVQAVERALGYAPT
jgi:hypothetical protein